MTKIHLAITARENYAKWACLCLDSLFRRGGVKPSDVIISFHAMLLGTVAADLLNSYGVKVYTYQHGDTAWGKFILLDRVFKDNPEVTEIIQLDCDIVLTEDMDFISRMHHFNPDALMTGYLAPSTNSSDLFFSRAGLYHTGFSPTGVESTRGRLNAYLSACFETSIESFDKYLQFTPWVYGGVIGVRRQVTNLLVWKAMVSFSWICTCDETAILLGMHYHWSHSDGQPLWVPIPQEYLGHRVNPPTLDLTTGPGMIHFAGDWYRIKNEKHNQILTEAFDAL